ncbi:uncharacterized protein LACBIDRAFT_318776 [Laccaria bicolor S238N-H82]|uniref:Predicted protein n=1 Tax=Laccaria bicolor (strain S238N-H82 / ATCC MYA-4686) TaxID=486041 RepID=B0D723_LACBS|nr:uncharacterized protein LACBIDRAFT_318776 [Laccaria bicolor S238N-H82]EDR09575.1 predicted protein [Laccaria bicolor S238N-H82]|eukprot:XP_001879924.1 predicted protein [Laccaria bicolor S238N-H82]
MHFLFRNTYSTDVIEFARKPMFFSFFRSGGQLRNDEVDSLTARMTAQHLHYYRKLSYHCACACPEIILPLEPEANVNKLLNVRQCAARAFSCRCEKSYHYE